MLEQLFVDKISFVAEMRTMSGQAHLQKLKDFLVFWVALEE